MPSVSRDTATQRMEGGAIESFSEELAGGYTVNFACFHPDVDHTPLLKGLPDDRCQCPHWGYVLQGRLTFRFPDSEESIEAGHAFYIPPGHAPVGNEPNTTFVQFTPTDVLRKTNAILMKNMEAMRAEA